MVFFFGGVVVGSHREIEEAFGLGNLETGDLEAVGFQDVVLDLLVGGLTLGGGQVGVLQVEGHTDCHIRIFSDQLNNRLHVKGAGKEIEGFGVGQGVAAGGQQLDVPGQGGGIAGDIDDPLRRHRPDGLDHVGRKPLPRRVHQDDLRAAARRADCPRYSCLASPVP